MHLLSLERLTHFLDRCLASQQDIAQVKIAVTEILSIGQIIKEGEGSIPQINRQMRRVAFGVAFPRWSD